MWTGVPQEPLDMSAKVDMRKHEPASPQDELTGHHIDLGDAWRENLPSGPEESTTPRDLRIPAHEHPAQEAVHNASTAPSMAVASSSALSLDTELELGSDWLAHLPRGPEQSTTPTHAALSLGQSQDAAPRSAEAAIERAPTLLGVATQSSGTWSAGGHVAVALLLIYEATNWVNFGLAVVSLTGHSMLGWLGLHNEYRETLELSDRSRKEFEFKPGALGYLHAEVSSPGVRWTAVAGISLISTFAASWNGNMFDGLMFSGFALGGLGVANKENSKFRYWERYAAYKSGKTQDEIKLQSVFAPILDRPGTCFLASDMLVGVRMMPLTSIVESPLIGGFVTLGVGLGVYGLWRTLVPTTTRDGGDTSEAALQMKMSSIQSAAFSVANALAESFMAIPIGLWAVSSYLITRTIQSQKR